MTETFFADLGGLKVNAHDLIRAKLDGAGNVVLFHSDVSFFVLFLGVTLTASYGRFVLICKDSSEGLYSVPPVNSGVVSKFVTAIITEFCYMLG